MLNGSTEYRVGNKRIQRLKSKVKKFMLIIWRLMPENIQGLILYLISKKLIIGVLAVINDHNGRILLFNHTYLGDKSWGLPGGAAKHEDLTKALQREVWEESQYLIDVGHNIGVVQYERRRIDFLFACSIKDGVFVASEEVVDYNYFYLDELPEMVIHHRIMLNEMSHTTNSWPRIDTTIKGFFIPLAIMNERKKIMSQP